MNYQIESQVPKAFEAQQVTERFRKREFVLAVNDNPKYPQQIKFQLTGDRCEQLDGIQEGTWIGKTRGLFVNPSAGGGGLVVFFGRFQVDAWV